MVYLTSYHIERARKKKLEILRTAAEIFNEKGYHGTTIEEIASQLKVTKASLYHYIANKEDLLVQCHEMVADTSISHLQEIINSNIDPKQKLLKAIDSHIKNICEEKSMFNIIISPSDIFSKDTRNTIIQKRDVYELLLLEILQEGMDLGYFIQTDPKITLLQILGSLNSISRWYSPNGKKTQQEISDIFSSNFLKMLEV